MGRLRDIIRGPALESYLRRARRKLAAGELATAQRIVDRARVRFPGTEALKDAELSIRRAQAREGMQTLRARIQQSDDPKAYEELIGLYQEMHLHAEARSEAMAYARAHPDQYAPHLVLGEMSLKAFFADLRARDAHAAQHRLTRALRLDPEAVAPRLLLAELYYSVGADGILAELADDVAALAGDDEEVAPLLEAMRAVARPGEQDHLDGLFERVDVAGAVHREAEGWPLHRQQREALAVDAAAAQQTADELVARGSAEEVALLTRGGEFLAHAAPSRESDVPPEEAELVRISRTVTDSVVPQVRELDLGAFRRCTVQGPWGLLTVGQLGGVVAGARWTRSPDAERMWQRVALGIEGALGVRP